jgi:hypothetical protein
MKPSSLPDIQETAGEETEDAALPIGFVDVKVSAVDDGCKRLRLVVRKKPR